VKEIFKGQIFNYFILYFLLAGVYQIVANFSGFLDGSLWGIETKIWFFIAICSPIVHQFFVWFCWRFELHRSLLTKAFGSKAFGLYKIDFTILILSRPVSVVLLALSNQDSLHLNHSLGYAISILLAIPAIYLFYSVVNYFGFDRAWGVDHFKTEEAIKLPMVKEGIFKYSRNGMYAFGFLILYLPGFIWLSKSAILLAIFNHLYIWSHYYFTEKSDMNIIYGEKQ